MRLRENGGHAALRRGAEDPPRDRGAAQRDRSRTRRAGVAHHAVPPFGPRDPLGGVRPARRLDPARVHVRVERLGRCARIRGDARVLARHRTARTQARPRRTRDAHRWVACERRSARRVRRTRAPVARALPPRRSAVTT